MPWIETNTMDQRIQFIGDWLSGRYSKTELCKHYHISRPTGDQLIARYRDFGLEGLKDRSRAAKHHPNAVPDAICERIVRYKLAHPQWGPKKVMDGLRREDPDVAWPVDSTAGAILQRAGLVSARRRRRKTPPQSAPLAHCDGANAVWSADFKGDFELGDGQRCYPLTVTDNHSRYLLQCRARRMRGSSRGSNGCFENMDCRSPSARITAPRSPRVRPAASAGCRPGGCAWGFGPNAPNRAGPIRMGATSGCTAR